MRKVLVTGATGFLGAAVVRRLITDSEVAAMIRPQSDLWRLNETLAARGCMLMRGDVLGTAGMLGIARRFQPDVIVHAAMSAGHPRSQAELAESYRTAVFGTLNALEAAKECGAAFIHFGSSLVHTPGERLSEESPIAPVSSRGAAKAAALVAFQQFAREWRIPSCELRVFSAYGPGQQPGRFIPRLLDAAATGEAIAVRPGPRHDYVHADDIAEACALAIGRVQHLAPAEVFLIGGGVEISNQETVAAVEQATGRTIDIAADAYGVPHPSDAAHWSANIAKAGRLLGWRPKVDFVEGLRQMAAWREQQQTVEGTACAS